MTKKYRHGDVIVKEITEIPVLAKRTDNFVLAEGEVTGHKHRIVGRQVQVFETDRQKYINAQSEATLMHEEHNEIKLPQGKYEVIIQREYEPVQERKVRD